MTLLDAVLILILGYNTFIGLKKGAIRMIGGLLGLILAALLSKRLFVQTYPLTATTIPALLSYPALYYIVCFLCLLLIASAITEGIHYLFNISGMGILNHIIGGLLGICRGIILSFFLLLPLYLSQSPLLQSAVFTYDVIPFFMPALSWLKESTFFNDALRLLHAP